MAIIKPSRRGFLTGLTALFVAPAIVKVENIMPVKIIKPDDLIPYKGIHVFDAGFFYCPYVPLVLAAPSFGKSFPAIEFKTRYGVVNEITR